MPLESLRLTGFQRFPPAPYRVEVVPVKIRILGIFSLLVGVSFLILGCPAKTTTPTTPSGPANTPTVTDSPTITLSPTQTGTPTNSFTPTVTRTNTNTATVTDTPTATNSATNSATPTNTGTPTNTATITETFTITDTATNTSTSTETLSPTQTFSPTETLSPTQTGTSTNTVQSTPTITLTFTTTPTASPSPTATVSCSGSYSISGTVDYTGSTVSGDSLVMLFVSPSQLNGGGGNGCNVPTTFVSSTTGSYAYSMPNLSAGTYYVIGSYGTYGSNGPNLGNYVGDYGSTCTLTTSTKEILSSGNQNPTGVNVTFGTTHQLWGVNATVNYGGSQTGGSLQVGLFTGVDTSTGAYNFITSNGVNASGDTESLIDTNDGCITSGPTISVIGWYGSSYTGPNAGDNYAVVSTTEVNNPTTTITVDVSPSATWN
jgi:hypothetical protein